MSGKIRWVVCACGLLFAALGYAQKSMPAYQSQTVASGLSFPWSLAFLPDGRLLVTERTGQLRVVSGNALSSPLGGLPDDIYVAGQGGLMEVVLHPEFTQNRWIYLSYASGTANANALKVVRARLTDNALTEMTDILTVAPHKDTPVHYGGRMAFLPDMTLLITSGDGFDYREDAQRLTSQLGKILRIRDDGSLPLDNPHRGQNLPDAARVIFSHGHRNPQAVLYDPDRKVIFAHEHGPAGGDEINLIHAGNNYGWPVITNGKDYSGASISPFTNYPGMELPLLDWTPSIAPSGMALYRGFMFDAMRGDLLVSSLKDKQVLWVQMDNFAVTGQVPLFAELEARIRDVRVHPDGSIYLLTDSEDGKIVRIVRDSSDQ